MTEQIDDEPLKQGDVIKLDKNQAALIITLEDDKENCRINIASYQNFDELPINVKIVYTLASLLQDRPDNNQFATLLIDEMDKLFQEPTMH